MIATLRRPSRETLRSLVVPAVVALFAFNFNSYRVESDGTLYYAFQQHLFGDPPIGVPTAYNFGLAILNAPFYAVGRFGARLEIAGSLSPALPAAAFAAAASFYLVVATLLCRRLVRELGWEYSNGATLLAVFGSPVWYYGAFLPSLTHAADAAMVSLAALLVLRLWRVPSLRYAALAGMAIGVAATVRPFNVGILGGLCLALAAHRRWRDAFIAGGSGLLAAGALTLIPYLSGAQFHGVGAGSLVGFYPLSPVRMLFTDHRGLFVWTPLTLLAAIGLAMALLRRPRDGFLLALAAMAGGLLCMYSLFEAWDAGWSFSARYLSSLLPVYTVGLAAFLCRARATSRRFALGLAVFATCWGMFIGLNHAFGTADQPDGAKRIASAYIDGRRTPAQFVRFAWAYSRARHVVELVIR